MIPSTLRATVMLRGDTAADWVRKNPVLNRREPGLEMDTRRFKVGNGRDVWVDLPYWPYESTDADEVGEIVAAYFEANPPQPGPQGDIGPQGPKGETGAKGEKGDRGDAGPQGAAGVQGSKGDVGEKGATGAAGPAGPQGPTGATGAQGPQGGKGDTGAVGPQGPAGVKGDTGATGATGAQGPAGAAATTLVGTATVSEQVPISLVVQVRQVTVNVPGTVVAGSYFSVPVNKPPIGYGVLDSVCSTPGQLTVSIFVPVVQLLTTYSIPIRVHRVNS